MFANVGGSIVEGVDSKRLIHFYWLASVNNNSPSLSKPWNYESENMPWLEKNINQNVSMKSRNIKASRALC